MPSTSPGSGDYRDEVAASEQRIAAHLSEDQETPVRFGIRLCGHLIGRVDLVPVEPPRYGLGYWLSADATGHGYATTAVAAIVGYGRNDSTPPTSSPE